MIHDFSKVGRNVFSANMTRMNERATSAAVGTKIFDISAPLRKTERLISMYHLAGSIEVKT